MISSLDKKAKITTLLYQLTRMVVITSTFLFPFYYFVGNHFYMPIQALATAFFSAITFFFLRKKWLVLSAYWLFSTLTLSLTIASFLTPDVAVELMMIPISVALLTVFEDRKHALLLFGLILINFLVMEFFREDIEPVIIFNEAEKKGVYIFNMISIFGLCFTIVWQVWKTSNQFEEELRASHQTIKEKNEEIKTQSELLIEEQKIRHTLEMERKQKDLEYLHANNRMKIQVKQSLLTDLEKIPKSENPQKELHQVIFKIKEQLQTEDKLDLIQENMNTVSADFQKRLVESYPQLSKTEREICLFIKLNMSTKEIANIRNTSVNTINVTKNRLRKKLGMERNDELVAFLQGF